MGDTLLTMRQAAKFKGLSLHNFYYQLRQGYIKPDARIGQSFLFRKSTLDSWEPKQLKRGRGSRPRGFQQEQLTLRQVAEELGITIKEMRALVSSGRFPVDGKVSGVRFVWRKTLDAWKEKHDSGSDNQISGDLT